LAIFERIILTFYYKFFFTMKLLEGKVALISGAGRGIGKAVALRFAENGADVAFTDLELNDAVLSTVAELEQYGVKVKAYASNAADFEQTHKVVDEVIADFGRIDILVNNAGITKDGLMMRMGEAQWDAVINVNLKSAFNFIHAVTPIMARQRGGSIINMSSVVGVSGNAGQCNYSASKAGMIGLAKSIAKEMGPRGIRANCIAPGFIITEMTNALSEEVREQWSKAIPLRRGGTPEDVANVALFLASDLSGYVSGQVIHCCGGMNM
jgi:3-oxoacyl-[acyl-carrier protein] reductase